MNPMNPARLLSRPLLQVTTSPLWVCRRRWCGAWTMVHGLLIITACQCRPWLAFSGSETCGWFELFGTVDVSPCREPVL